MAKELQIAASVNFNKGGAQVGRRWSSKIDVAGSVGLHNTKTIATSDTTLPIEEIGTIGYVAFHNLDATNYVDIGPDGSSYPIRLMPGEFSGPIHWNAAAVHCKANTASCKLEYVAVEA
jgi:hypothetical protein